MERPIGSPHAAPEDLVERVRGDLDRSEADGDEARLETLESIRGDLEAELDSSLENGAPGH